MHQIWLDCRSWSAGCRLCDKSGALPSISYRFSRRISHATIIEVTKTGVRRACNCQRIGLVKAYTVAFKTLIVSNWQLVYTSVVFNWIDADSNAPLIDLLLLFLLTCFIYKLPSLLSKSMALLTLKRVRNTASVPMVSIWPHHHLHVVQLRISGSWLWHYWFRWGSEQVVDCASFTILTI